MLQISPDSALKPASEETTDDGLFCARCDTLVTRTRWTMSMDGHEHAFFNPAGLVFRILCFSEAPGAQDRGAPTDEFTWFPGYQWIIACCAGCGEHLGWRYLGGTHPQGFFGLIKDRLTGKGRGADR